MKIKIAAQPSAPGVYDLGSFKKTAQLPAPEVVVPVETRALEPVFDPREKIADLVLDLRESRPAVQDMRRELVEAFAKTADHADFIRACVLDDRLENLADQATRENWSEEQFVKKAGIIAGGLTKLLGGAGKAIGALGRGTAALGERIGSGGAAIGRALTTDVNLLPEMAGQSARQAFRSARAAIGPRMTTVQSTQFSKIPGRGFETVSRKVRGGVLGQTKALKALKAKAQAGPALEGAAARGDVLGMGSTPWSRFKSKAGPYATLGLTGLFAADAIGGATRPLEAPVAVNYR